MKKREPASFAFDVGKNSTITSNPMQDVINAIIEEAVTNYRIVDRKESRPTERIRESFLQWIVIKIVFKDGGSQELGSGGNGEVF